MPLTTWNLFEGVFCFMEWWKVGWCEVRWIRWLAELHQTAYSWDCANRLGADLRFPSSRNLSRPSLGALRSPIRLHWQLFPNFEQLTSARCLTFFKVLTPPPPPSSFQSENTRTSYGFISTNTFTHFMCSVVSACSFRICRNSLFISFLHGDESAVTRGPLRTDRLS